MAKPHRTAGDLEVAEDFEFQKRVWRMQRAGWGVLALVVLGAGAGVFGHGPLSSSKVRSGDGTFAYDSIARSEAPIEWRVRAPAAADGTLRVAIGYELLRDIKVEAVAPAPSHIDSRAEGLVYRFVAKGPTEISLRARTLDWGRASGRVAINDGEPALVSMFILP